MTSAAGDLPSTLGPGDRFRTDTLVVTEALRREVVRIGGYTHPLFARPGEIRLPQGSPLPGQAVLLIMGGLVEQAGRLDHAIAMLGMTEVLFRSPAVPGTELAVEVEIGSCAYRAHGRGVLGMTWIARDQHGTSLVEATVRMLVHLDEEAPLVQ